MQAAEKGKGMIVIKEWKRTKMVRRYPRTYFYRGWFLLGIIPLMIYRRGAAS